MVLEIPNWNRGGIDMRRRKLFSVVLVLVVSVLVNLGGAVVLADDDYYPACWQVCENPKLIKETYPLAGCDTCGGWFSPLRWYYWHVVELKYDCDNGTCVVSHRFETPCDSACPI